MTVLFYVITGEGNQALQDFLHSLNPRQQHSTAVESYLIKPIQRILKYPLLLTQMKNLAVSKSDEQQHLIEALIGETNCAEWPAFVQILLYVRAESSEICAELGHTGMDVHIENLKLFGKMV